MNLAYYLKITVRNLIREKKYSFFLFSSICIGFITFILVSGYVFYENSYDKIFPDSRNIYRVTTDIYNGNELSISIPECERAIASSLKENYPEIISAGFITGTGNPQYKIGEDIFTNNKVYHASPGFLDVFSIVQKQGIRSQILLKPYTAIISESTAKKYFGEANPIGKTIFKYPAYDYTVEGVFEDIPRQAHFDTDILLSFHDNMNLPPPAKAPWGETSFYTYLKLNKNADIGILEARINKLVSENKKGFFEENNTRHEYHLQPLEKIHLYSDLKNELDVNSDAKYLYLVFIVGFLILIASGFNYIHFSFSRLINTAKYTGIKKINGANNSGILLSSFSESFLMHLGAMAFSLVVAWLLIPIIRNQFGITLEPVFANSLFLCILLLTILISIVVNGVLPAILINRYNGLELLKLKYKPVSKGISFRQAIVVAQFVIVIAIFSAIVGINKQVNFMAQKDKGCDIENIIVVKVPRNIRKSSQRINNLQAFENELKSNPIITGFSSSNKVPGDIPAYNFNFMETESGKGGKAAVIVADENYIKNYNIGLIAGRNFSANSNSGELNGCIINNACLSALGFRDPEDALGKLLKMKDESGMQNFDIPVIGISENVDFSNVKEGHEPIILINWTGDMLWGNYSIKTVKTDFASVIPFLKEIFYATFPNYPFEYFVLEDYYNKQFDKEIQLVKMLRIFILIAILISVINLFSISWLISLARVKEIGIRKVNGAKISEILTMLNKDFVKWVAFAFVIATPIAYYAMNKWLENFAYKTTLSWWIFALAGLLALGIALLTVSWQSWRAASRNPVEALRYE